MKLINSQNQLEKARNIIPLQAQTYSKSKLQFTPETSPLFAGRAKGAYLWDIDGNKYIDMVNGLCAITLGHSDQRITNAVKKQLNKGSVFSLSSKLELEVAERISDIIPCAEMVRFGKNGTDATTAAVRIARAYTGRDHIASCGYHGSADWSVCATTRNAGIPASIGAMTHKFNYNDIQSLQDIFLKHSGEIACVIMEAMNVEYPKDDFLEKCKELAHANGALFILDEVITAFRFRNSAQEEFGVTPDLCALGKGLASGYPLSAVAGKREFMKLLEPDDNNGDSVMFSMTFGGDCVALAAANEVLKLLVDTNYTQDIYDLGDELMTRTRLLLNQYRCIGITLTGHPSWSHFHFTDIAEYKAYQVRSLFIQECIANGVLSYGANVISAALSYDNIDRLLDVYNDVLLNIAIGWATGDLEQMIIGKTLAPVMGVRGK